MSIESWVDDLSSHAASRNLELCTRKQSILYRYIMGSWEPDHAEPDRFAGVLAYLMKNIDVRRPEEISDELNRELVRSTFEIIRSKHMLENNLATPSYTFEKINAARERVEGVYTPESYPAL
jgi:hypothetical protein